MLVVLLLSVLRVLCLSLMVALIYSGAVLITFIFVVMTFDLIQRCFTIRFYSKGMIGDQFSNPSGT